MKALLTPQPRYAALTLRLALALMFLAHGATKLFVFTPSGTVGYFASLGLPAAFAYLAMIGEIGGGLLLLSGLYARWIALALIPLLAGTIVTVHGHNGWMFANAGGGWEYPAFLIAASLALFFLGDGRNAAAIKG